MKFEKTEVFNFEGALRGMRNPKESWALSDSYYGCVNGSESHSTSIPTKCQDCLYSMECNNKNKEYNVGEKDFKLARTLIQAGSEHRKFLRQIMLTVDITAPLYFWKEFDTYKVGTTANSTSSMHLAHKREFKLEDFTFDVTLQNNYSDRLQKDVEICVDKEIWKDIVGYEGIYKISNSGKILRLPYTITNIYGKNVSYAGKMISTPVNSSGYKKCVLRKNGEMKNYYLHRLMAEAFIENKNSLPVVNHKDGNKLNCNLSNLEWCTYRDNDLHAVKLGVKFTSNYNKIKLQQKFRKFSELEINQIFDLYENGYTQKEISKIFECYDSTINNIVNGKTYKDIEIDEITGIRIVIDQLNYLRNLYISTKDINFWRQMIQLIPSSYNQTRTVTMNYENVLTMYHQRKNHKLTEWSVNFINWCESLPYFKEMCLK